MQTAKKKLLFDPVTPRNSNNSINSIHGSVNENLNANNKLFTQKKQMQSKDLSVGNKSTTIPKHARSIIPSKTKNGINTTILDSKRQRNNQMNALNSSINTTSVKKNKNSFQMTNDEFIFTEAEEQAFTRKREIPRTPLTEKTNTIKDQGPKY